MTDTETLHQTIYKAVHGRVSVFLGREDFANAVWLGTEDAAKAVAALTPPEPTGVVQLATKLLDFIDNEGPCAREWEPISATADALREALRSMPLQERVTLPGADGPDPNMPAAGWSKP